MWVCFLQLYISHLCHGNKLYWSHFTVLDNKCQSKKKLECLPPFCNSFIGVAAAKHLMLQESLITGLNMLAAEFRYLSVLLCSYVVVTYQESLSLLSRNICLALPKFGFKQGKKILSVLFKVHFWLLQWRSSWSRTKRPLPFLPLEWVSLLHRHLGG